MAGESLVTKGGSFRGDLVRVRQLSAPGGENDRVNETREAEELVRLWQELQTAEVEGDTRRLASLRALAETNARRPNASGEWQVLAREAARHLGGARDHAEAEPTTDVAAETVEVGEPESPQEASKPAEEAEKTGGLKLGPLIWVVVVVAYLLLQLLGNAGEGGG